MANDIDMWKELESGMLPITERADLFKCYFARYQKGDYKLAEKLKEKFNEKYGYWNNWY